MTTKQWPSIGARIRREGIANPIRDVPTMWALLDIVESLLMEGCEDEKARQKLWQALYVPPAVPVSQVKELPPGFRPDEEMNAFAAMMGNNQK